jgi:hypothetical protein
MPFQKSVRTSTGSAGSVVAPVVDPLLPLPVVRRLHELAAVDEQVDLAGRRGGGGGDEGLAGVEEAAEEAAVEVGEAGFGRVMSARVRTREPASDRFVRTSSSGCRTMRPRRWKRAFWLMIAAALSAPCLRLSSSAVAAM